MKMTGCMQKLKKLKKEDEQWRLTLPNGIKHMEKYQKTENQKNW